MERDEKRDYLVSLRESIGMTRKDFKLRNGRRGAKPREAGST